MFSSADFSSDPLPTTFGERVSSQILSDDERKKLGMHRHGEKEHPFLPIFSLATRSSAKEQDRPKLNKSESLRGTRRVSAGRLRAGLQHVETT